MTVVTRLSIAKHASHSQPSVSEEVWSPQGLIYMLLTRQVDSKSFVQMLIGTQAYGCNREVTALLR